MAIGMQKNVQNRGPRSTTSPKQSEDVEGVDVIDVSKKFDPKFIIIGVVVVLIVVGIVILFTTKSNNKGKGDAKKVENTETAQQVDENSTESDVEGENDSVEVQTGDKISPGTRDLWDEGIYSTPATVYSATDYIADLNGNNVSAVYNVSEKNYVTDYVSYTSKRAIIDNGMEMYWLEADYDGKAYRIQIPYQYYVNLGDKGICKVNMEVLTLEGGGTIISYMQVVNE